MIDPALRHQMFVQRLAGRYRNELLRLLDDTVARLEQRLLEGVSEFQQARIARLLVDIRGDVGDFGGEFRDGLLVRMTEFAEYEAEFTHRMLDAAVTAQAVLPTVEQLAATVTSRPASLVSGDTVIRRTVRQMVEEFTTGRQREIASIVRGSVIEGRTVQETAREVRRVVTTRTRQQAEALVRTATNHIGGEARKLVYQANADILEGEKYLATLDLRTTITCAGFDGQVFPLGQGPQPPLHYNCRSVRVPVIKEEFRLDVPGERASMDGPVDGRTTFGGWLKRQPAEVQDEILGAERAGLFRSGQVAIDRFTDSRGVVYSLGELRQREGLTLN